MPSSATAFFVPGFADDPQGGEAVYADLRAVAERDTGAVAHVRRIRQIQCRLDGKDRLMQVGDTDAYEGQTVTAIFQLGRGDFTIHCQTDDEPGRRTTLVVPRKRVYDVTDFGS